MGVPAGHPHSVLLNVDESVLCRPEIRNAGIFPARIHRDVPRVAMEVPADAWPYSVMRLRAAASADDENAHTYPEAPASPRLPNVY